MKPVKVIMKTVTLTRNVNEVYSFRRITLAPIVILAGFAIEIYAIFRKPTKR